MQDPIQTIQNHLNNLKGTPQNQTFPVHDYFLTKVGIHTLENLNLKKLANESVYESCTMILPLKSKGSAGSPIRPVAIKQKYYSITEF